MNFSFYIAKRYLISKKSHNIINIISGISVVGVTIGTLALIIVLSVFNGFESVVVSLYNSFNPDLSITISEGKTFDTQSFPVDEIKKIPGVVYFTEVIEENAILKYNSKQSIVTIKGVNEDFQKMTGISSMMINGDFIIQDGDESYAVLGYIIDFDLGINLNDYSSLIGVYVPRRGKIGLLDPLQAFNHQYITPSGVFSIQQDFDSKYVIVPLHFARNLLDYTNEVTSIEIGTNPKKDLDNIQENIQELLGERYIVKNRFQQNEVLYKIMNSEKLGIYLILTFILFIATFNVIGSLSMLILDKKKDIAILQSMGANNKVIRRIFLTEGLLISMAGAIFGLVLGGLICWAQMEFGLIQLQGGGSFVISAYPVQMQFLDFVYVFLIVFTIGLGAVWYPVRQISKKHLHQRI